MSTEQSKDGAILNAARDAFARYGLRRTSMEDIAKASGMSRPALYLRFAGKEEIFHTLVQQHFAQAEATVAELIKTKKPITELLLAFFHAIDGEFVELMLNSPHANELFSPDSPVNQDVVRAYEMRIVALLARWIDEGAKAGKLTFKNIGGSAKEIANIILASKHGIKAASKDFASYRAAEARLSAMFGRALSKS